MSPERSSLQAWWLQPLAAQLRELGCDGEGLSADQARERLQRFGRNTFADQRRRPAWVQFLTRFRNPLVLILLAASAVSGVTGQLTSTLIIAAIILFSVVLDFLQEYRAGRAVRLLSESVAVRASVRRDGQRRDVLASEVVPGDLVELHAGDLVPADARVIEARDLFVRQALLTGEPYPVEKQPDEVEADDLAQVTNAVFMGTSVLTGTARVVVVRSGKDTAMGAIAGTLARQPPPTAFETGTRRFGLLIGRLTVLLVLFVLLVNTLFGRPWLESFLFALALAVGLTPELLPMVVSVTLSHGAIRMAKRRVIVRRLSAIEDLGSMDLLCTDKTGTLTEAKIRLERHVDAWGRDSERVLELAYLNGFFETGLRSPLDDAILEHTHVGATAWSKIDEVPFDFERRRVSVLLDDGQRRLLVVKGAPEDLIEQSSSCEDGNAQTQRPLDTAVAARLRVLGDAGFRTRGIAWRELSRSHEHCSVSDEKGLVFCGFAAFLDPPKSGRCRGSRCTRLERCGGQDRHRRQRASHATRVPCAAHPGAGRAHGARHRTDGLVGAAGRSGALQSVV